MNLGTLRKLEIKKCVTLKGTWGGLDPGRLLLTGEKNPKSDDSGQDPLFLITGNNVRIEGLRFQGPVVTYKEEDRAPTQGFDTAVHIKDAYNVVIENNDFSFWNQAVLVNPPRMTPRQANLIRITRNYFHRNANERHGYGVVLGDGDGYVAIEGNLFDAQSSCRGRQRSRSGRLHRAIQLCAGRGIYGLSARVLLEPAL